MIGAAKPCWAMSPLVVSQLLPADRQLLRRRGLRRGQPGHPGRRGPGDPARRADRRRRRREPAAADEPSSPASTDDADEPTIDRADELPSSLTSGFESILDALAASCRIRMLELALPQPRRAADRVLQRRTSTTASLMTFPGVTGASACDPSRATCRCQAGLDGRAQSDSPRSTGSSSSSSSTPRAPEREPRRDRHGHQARRPHRRGAAPRLRRPPRAGRVLRREPRAGARSSSRTSSASRATSATRSSSSSATARTPTAGCSTASARSTRRRRAPAQRRRHPRAAPDDRCVARSPPPTWTPTAPGRRRASCCGATSQYAESAATNLGRRRRRSPQLNPFELDIRDALNAAGIPLDRASTASPATASTSPPSTPTSPAGWCWPSRPTAPATTPPNRPRPRPAPPGAARAARLAVPPHLVHGLVPRPDHRSCQSQGRVRRERSATPTGHHRDHHPGPAASALATTAPSPAQDNDPSSTPARPSTSTPRTRWCDLVRWIESDGLLRTEDQLLAEVMGELGLAGAVAESWPPSHKQSEPPEPDDTATATSSTHLRLPSLTTTPGTENVTLDGEWDC